MSTPLRVDSHWGAELPAAHFRFLFYRRFLAATLAWSQQQCEEVVASASSRLFEVRGPGRGVRSRGKGMGPGLRGSAGLREARLGLQAT